MNGSRLSAIPWLCLGWILGLSTTSVFAQDFPISTSDTNVGYVDPATIANRFRIRADAGLDMFPPDRAEFFLQLVRPELLQVTSTIKRSRLTVS